MPVLVLLGIIIVVLIGFGAYQVGYANGFKDGKVEEANKYKEEINVETKQVLVD